MKPISVRSRMSVGHERQAGVMLLEALIAIFIFSVGILAMLGMQATAIHQARQRWPLGGAGDLGV